MVTSSSTGVRVASMTERPSDSGGLSSGDPLGGGDPEPPRHESGLPGAPPAPERPSSAPGYGSPPPPGAGGPIAQPAYGGVTGRYVLASWPSRVGAQLIDGLIIGIGALILFLPIGAALGAVSYTHLTLPTTPYV